MKDIKISVPKGRAYINWFGKKPIDTVSFYPAQLVEKTQESDDIKDLEFSTLEKIGIIFCFMVITKKYYQLYLLLVLEEK